MCFDKSIITIVLSSEEEEEEEGEESINLLISKEYCFLNFVSAIK